VTAYTGRLACLRCGDEHPEADAFGGCPRCAADGAPANLAPVYDISPGPLPDDPGQPGLFRHRSLLPLADTDPVVSLGEGDSPLLPLHRMGQQFGLDGLWIKDESRGPTWSYKDRLAAVAVSKARASGADTAVVSTTGNHGAAVAAYCAAAGIRCVALTLTSVPSTMRTLMQVYGAQVVAYREPVHRWTVMAAAVAERGWVPMSGFVNPPIGSNPFGIEGYKSVAYEIVEQLGAAPDVVVVPTAYADGLSGITRGFGDLHRLGVIGTPPRMVAAEPFGPYGASLAGGGDVAGPVPVRPSVAFSIATPVGTYQGLDALRRTGGTAVTADDDDEIMRMQALLAGTEGLYLEASSVLPLLAVQRMRSSGALRGDETVVVIGTSTGLKDVGATAARLPEPPVAEPTLADLDRALDGVLDRARDGARADGSPGLVVRR
jgi:threonine synthase